jgi:hypothetical protein
MRKEEIEEMIKDHIRNIDSDLRTVDYQPEYKGALHQAKSMALQSLVELNKDKEVE